MDIWVVSSLGILWRQALISLVYIRVGVELLPSLTFNIYVFLCLNLWPLWRWGVPPVLGPHLCLSVVVFAWLTFGYDH